MVQVWDRLVTYHFQGIFCISPLSTVRKKYSQERRVILDLSFLAINEGIPKDFYLGNKIDLTFPRVDDLANLIKVKGRHRHCQGLTGKFQLT